MKTLLALALGLLPLCGAHAAAEFGYEGVVNLIQAGNLRTIEELLPRLPADFRSNYTLMRESRSLQQADPQNPRVILFGKNAKLTCAFNGDPAQIGYDTLECIQFRDAERAFDFRQIQFPTPKNHLEAVQFSKRGVSTDGAVSCSSCHYADPRPNWDSYPQWPGAYGEFDDDLGAGEADYASFVRLRGSHPRYRALIQDSDPVAPYLEDTSTHLFGTRRPNLRYSDLANKWNSLRVARIMSADLPRWQMLAFSVSALHCTFTPEQQARIDQAHKNFSKDSDIETIFGNLGKPERSWSTQISEFADRYDHNSGFGKMDRDVGMSVVQDLAQGGNSSLKSTLAAVVAGYASNEQLVRFRDVELFDQMGAIIPEIYLADDSIRPRICSELVATFLAAWLPQAR